MLIDPFTVIVQVINFSILLVALKLLLFDRIVKHMDARQQRLVAQREEAEDRLAEAEEKGRELDRRLAHIEREREDLMSQAREEASKRRQQLLEEARHEVDEQRDRWSRALEEEQDQMLERIRGRIGEQVIEVVRTALSDLADRDLQDQMLAAFERRIDELDPDERDDLRSWIGQDGKPAVVSTHKLDEDERARVGRVLRDLVGGDVEAEFSQDESLIGGLEIQAGGRAFGWTIDGYLEQVEESLQEVVGRGRAEEGAGAASG